MRFFLKNKNKKIKSKKSKKKIGEKSWIATAAREKGFQAPPVKKLVLSVLPVLPVIPVLFLSWCSFSLFLTRG
jgi:hypothetical protein